MAKWREAKNQEDSRIKQVAERRAPTATSWSVAYGHLGEEDIVKINLWDRRTHHVEDVGFNLEGVK